jgi:hypothetical protein
VRKNEIFDIDLILRRKKIVILLVGAAVVVVVAFEKLMFKI